MIAAVILAASMAFWPFHRHHEQPLQPPAVVQSEGSVTIRDGITDDQCTHSGDLWFYFGSDNATGIGLTCFDAFQDWKNTYSPAIVYNTI